MNKILKKISFLLLIVLVFSACKKTSEGVSSVTTYAEMELNGASTLFWQLGEPFVDPGCKATEGETDLTASITVNSNVDATKGGQYSMTYSVNNSDGFPATISRQVVVCDKAAPLNGYYESRIVRTYTSVQNRGPFTLLVFGVGGNKYYIQDLIGRWYDVGSGYGSAYAGSGIVQLNNDNTLTLVSSKALGFGATSAPVFFDVSSYNPATKTIALNSIMGDTPTMLFRVSLTNPSPLN